MRLIQSISLKKKNHFFIITRESIPTKISKANKNVAITISNEK